MRVWKKENGVLSLEASICLTIFIFFMLFLYSFFVFFEARNEIGHVVLSTANSMAVDTYSTATLGERDAVTSLLYNIYGQKASEDSKFVDYTQWYNSDAAMQQVLKERFIAYLTGGEEGNAEAILERLNVEGGVGGLDFSESTIDGDKLNVVVKYTLEYEFNMFGLGKNKIQQSACSKLWKK